MPCSLLSRETKTPNNQEFPKIPESKKWGAEGDPFLVCTKIGVQFFMTIIIRKDVIIIFVQNKEFGYEDGQFILINSQNGI